MIALLAFSAMARFGLFSDYVRVPNYIVHVTSSARGPTHMSVLEAATKRLITSTKLDSSEVYEITAHAYKPALSFIALKSKGQYGQTAIYRIDPKSRRPVEMLDALMGDPSKLSQGIVEETSFTHYVDREDWPKGVNESHKPVHRTWRFDCSTFKFQAGKWQKG
jgi:hypothetical protein